MFMMIQRKVAPLPALGMVLISDSVPARDVPQQPLPIQESSCDLRCPRQLKGMAMVYAREEGSSLHAGQKQGTV